MNTPHTSTTVVQQQNQALLEAIEKAASGILDLNAMQTAIQTATTSFEVRGYTSRLAAFQHSDAFEALNPDETEHWCQLVLQCSKLDRKFHILGFQQTGQWDFQDIRVSYLPKAPSDSLAGSNPIASVQRETCHG